MGKQIIASIFLGFWAAAASAAAPAENPALSPANRQQLAQRRLALEKMLADAEQRYGETAASLYALRTKAKHKQQQLEAIRSDMQKLEYKIDQEQKILAAQLKAAYQMGRQEQLKLLFNQQDPVLSGRMLRYYHYLTSERLAKIKAVTALVTELEQSNRQIQQQSAELENLLDQKQNQQDLLARAKSQRSQLLSQLSKLSPQQQLTQLQEQEAILKNLLSALPDADVIADQQVASSAQERQSTVEVAEPAAPFASLKGKLHWPVKGRIAKKFGSSRLQTLWDGILITAPEGAEVHAVADGDVVFANWFKNFGYLMVVKHDKDHMSLYGYNASLYKRQNDQVRAGEVIAAVGQSGGRSQPGLYFSIRKQGVPVDPVLWCAR